MNINDLVEEVLRTKIGGEEFFTEIDSRVAHPDYSMQLIQLVEDTLSISTYTERLGLIVTGKFGLYFYAFLVNKPEYNGEVDSSFVITNGDLRVGVPCISLESYKDSISIIKDYILIDDSYYSGTTRCSIENELAKFGGNIVEVFVAYDGSHDKDPKVHSLYRYYDHH